MCKFLYVTVLLIVIFTVEPDNYSSSVWFKKRFASNFMNIIFNNCKRSSLYEDTLNRHNSLMPLLD